MKAYTLPDQPSQLGRFFPGGLALLCRKKTFRLALTAACALLLSSTLSHASLLLYEPFNYTAGGSLTGENGGTGFTSAWSPLSGSEGTTTVQANSLTYSTLPTSGNKVYINPTSTTSGESRDFSNLNSGTVYLSFLANIDEGQRFFALRLTDAGGQKAFIGRASGGSNWRVESNTGTTVTGATSIAASLDTTYFLVLRIDFSVSNARLRLYVDPTLGTEPLTADADITSSAAFQINGLNIATGFTSGAVTTAKGWYDEIRMGTTYADIAPVPEPTSGALFGLSLLGIIVLGKVTRRI